jgi:hypothetical protein
VDGILARDVAANQTGRVAVRYLGGPTALLEIGGLRLLTDPTFDPPAPASSPYTGLPPPWPPALSSWPPGRCGPPAVPSCAAWRWPGQSPGG